MPKLNKVLVVKLRHHGDVLLTSPVFSALKAHNPGCSIDALVYQDTSPMLLQHPDIENVYCIDKGWKKLGVKNHIKAEVNLLNQLKDNAYDTIIHLTESYRGLWIKYYCGIPTGITPQHRKRDNSWLWKKAFQHRYPVVPLRHTVDKHLDALRCIGIHPEDKDKYLSMANLDQSVLDMIKSKYQLENGYILIHPTSRWLFKCWDEKKVANTINHLRNEGHQVILSAAPDKKELQMIERIKAHLQYDIIDVSGQLSLAQLSSLIKHAKVMLGVDSVPMHIAAATQTPSVCLFGPSGDKEWGPWMSNTTVLTSSTHACRPCGRDGCAGSKVSDCLISIPESRVLKAIYGHLNDKN